MLLVCHHCKTEFNRQQKEINRQQKLGKTEFYCSRRCAAYGNKFHMANLKGNPVSLRQGGKRDDCSPFRQCIRSAKKRRNDTNLSPDYLQQVWNAQFGLCALTKIPLTLRRGSGCTQASLDRIDSTQGYVVGNVQFVCLPINLAKNSMSDSEVLNFLDLVRQHSVSL